MILFHPDFNPIALEELRESLLSWPSPNPDYCTLALRDCYVPRQRDKASPVEVIVPTRTAVFRRSRFSERTDNTVLGRELVFIEPADERSWQELREWIASDPRHKRYMNPRA
jgi:hypothetical protein